jgi:hypothetical protein
MRSISSPARFPVAIPIFCAVLAACSGGSPAPGAQLFPPSEARLSPADAAAVTALVADMFPPDADGRFVHPDCGPLDPIVDVTDLNRDGNDEVFVQWGNLCTSGMTGSSLSLYLKGPSGAWQQELGFPASGYRVLTRGDDYPDLEIGGPGFCFPVWSWTGAAYEYACSLPQTGGTCPADIQICPAQ